MSVHEGVQRRLVLALDHPCRDLTRGLSLRGHNRRLALRPVPRPFQRLPFLVQNGTGGPCSVAVAVEGSAREGRSEKPLVSLGQPACDCRLGEGLHRRHGAMGTPTRSPRA